MTKTPATLLHEALNWRYATKKFDASRKIPPATWASLEESLVLAPSTFGIQPWKFLVVQDPATCAKLASVSWGQTQPVDCSHYVVFAVRKGLSTADVERLIARISEVRGVPAESLAGYRDVVVGAVDRARTHGLLDGWMSRQAYIALGQFMAAAALLRVDTCPMEGLDPQKYDEILGLPAQGYATLCACAAGYRASDDKYASLPKVRFKPEDVLVHV
jgi:nitroreductase